MDDIIASMGRAFSDNINPTSLSTLFTGKGRTFADNVKTTAGKLASRNPFFKGVATALTGYDFYFNQPLQDTESGKLSMCDYCERGANNKNMTSKKYSDVTVDIHKDDYVLSIGYRDWETDRKSVV